MDGKTTIKYLQNYIKEKDYRPEAKHQYFLKLAEEVGELAKAIYKDLPANADGDIKGTVDEEIWDVMYYALALANCYGIDVEKAIAKKEAINNQRYNTNMVFEENR